MQERPNSSALAMELRLSCTNPSIWYKYIHNYVNQACQYQSNYKNCQVCIYFWLWVISIIPDSCPNCPLRPVGTGYKQPSKHGSNRHLKCLQMCYLVKMRCSKCGKNCSFDTIFQNGNTQLLFVRHSFVDKNEPRSLAARNSSYYLLVGGGGVVAETQKTP